MNELNKALRFSKQNSDVLLRFPKITNDWRNIHFLVFSDAALGVRQDLASQGGYLILAVNDKVMSGEVGKYSIIGWRSYKLPRVCRSSLAAESQACATAIDELSIVKLIFGLLRDPNLNIKDDDAARGMRSAVIIDARALYDAIHKETFQSSLDKHVAIETLVIRDGLKYTNSELRWVSSERQMADGLTKLGGRQQMSDLLRGGYVQLIYDQSFTAAKKKSMQERKEINKVARGTAVAMYVSTMVATQVTGATATLEEAKALVEFKVAQEVKTLEDHLDTEIILTLVFVIMILLIMIYLIVKVFCAKNVQYEIEETQYVEAETQTETGAATNIATISHDEQMQLGSYIGALEEQIEKYKNEIQDNLADYVGHIDSMAMRHADETRHMMVWITQHGERWHNRPDCPAIVRKAPRALTFCQKCGEGEEQHSPSLPM